MTLKFRVESVIAMLMSGSSNDDPTTAESVAILKNIKEEDLLELADGINNKSLFLFKKQLLANLMKYIFEDSKQSYSIVKEYETKIEVLNLMCEGDSGPASEQFWKLAVGKETGIFTKLKDLSEGQLKALGQAANNQYLWGAILETGKLKGKDSTLLAICPTCHLAIDYLDYSRLKTMTKEELFLEAAQVSKAKSSQAYHWKHILPELEKYQNNLSKEEYYEMLKWSNHTIDLTIEHWSLKRLPEYSLDELAMLFSFLDKNDSRLKIISEVMLQKKK